MSEECKDDKAGEQVCMVGQTCEENPACCEEVLFCLKPKFHFGGALIETKDAKAYDFSVLLKMLKLAGVEIGLKAGADILLVIAEWLSNGGTNLDALLKKLKEKGLDYAEITLLRITAVVIEWLKGASLASENKLDDAVLLFVDFVDLQGQVALLLANAKEDLLK